MDASKSVEQNCWHKCWLLLWHNNLSSLLCVTAVSRNRQPSCGQLPGPWPFLDQNVEQNRRVLRNSWPWMAVIYDGDRPLCAGSILCCAEKSNQISFILTTATCLHNVRLHETDTDIWAAVGLYNLSRAAGATRCDGIRIVDHRFYNPLTDENNIALLKVRCPSRNSQQSLSTRCICPATPEQMQPLTEDNGQFVRTAGWGAGMTPLSRSSDAFLRERDLKVDAEAVCSTDARKICVYDQSRNVCPAQPGDDGAPVVLFTANNQPVVQVGVLEEGRQCRNPQASPQTSVIDISRYLPWINQALSQCWSSLFHLWYRTNQDFQSHCVYWLGVHTAQSTHFIATSIVLPGTTLCTAPVSDN